MDRGEPVLARRVALGAQLFFDPRLSATREVSCASCHDVLGGSGTTSTSVARGIHGRMGSRNPPTVWNAALREALFWDGRARSLEAQARGPITHPSEMGMEPARLARRLDAVSGYRRGFAAAFPARGAAEPVAFEEIVGALASFERTLVTGPSPFDRARAGDRGAVSGRAWRGWQTFQRLGCISCHGAPTFGRRDYFVRFPLRSVPELDFALGLTRDLGRGSVFPTSSGLAALANTWRVPSLRNVALTGPYFHNGSVSSLEQAVRLMGRAQLARTLTDDEVRDVVAFLESLTGTRPSIALPALPPG